VWKKEDSKSPGVVESSVAGASLGSAPRDAGGALPVSPRAAACISQGIRIKGEITGSEDLFVDGPIEGKLNLSNGSLTVGPNGSVKADVSAREVIVRGRVEGKIAGRERVQLWSTGQVNGEVQTQRLAIEDGAILRGKVETGRAPDNSNEQRVAATGKTSREVTAGSGTVSR
jgi:cytoskeletal protein CcmA (bactofilin family)